METKTDASYGVVPVHKTDQGVWEVLILNQRSFRGDVYWTLPKGHAEAGETPQAAALRELQEETGLTATLDLDSSFTQTYSFVHNGILIDKTVTYWLGVVNETTGVAQPEEVVELRWCTLPQALAQVTFAGTKDVLTSAAAKLGVTFTD